jgi:hypothetical protein
MAGTVTPIYPDVVIAVGRFVSPHEPPCPVCRELLGIGETPWCCGHCPVVMHAPCYWGRVAPMGEWIAHHRQMLRDDLPEDYCPDVVCAACRAAKGGA